MKKRSLQDWLAWQEKLHPAEIELGLERVKIVYQRMGSPKPARQLISVAGTNGKGSCVAMLREIYHKAGYRVGTYTSPHILRYNERIMIDGTAISDERLCMAFERIEDARDDISLTYFEFGTLAALLCFADVDLDIAVLEVGLGGRLDATNIIDADATLITTVDFDHEDWLGHSLDEIALEKAGIMREATPAVYGDSNPPAAMTQYAKTHSIPLQYLGSDYQYHQHGKQWDWHGEKVDLRDLPAPNLKGGVQFQNAAAVLSLIQQCQSALPVGREAIVSALKSVSLAGRFSIVSRNPTVILDVAHNPQAINELVENIQAIKSPVTRCHIVWGVFKDKNAGAITARLSEIGECWYIAELDSPRTLSLQEMTSFIQQASDKARISTHKSIVLAYEQALSVAKAEDIILVTGSFLTVSAIMEHGKHG